MATWGQQTWGFENWGTLGDQTVDLSSVSLSATLSQGTVTVDAELQVGWGADSWGENAWGELSGAYVDVSGISLTTNIGTISVSGSALTEPSGVAATFGIGQITQRIDAAFTVTGIEAQALIGNSEYASKITVSGVSAQTNTGQATVDPTFLIGEGWGRDTYGNLGWGVNYSVIGGGANGIPITIVTGNEDAFTDVTVEVTTAGELQTAITPVGTSANSDNEIAHSFLLNQDLGAVTLEGHANVDVTGISQSIEIGDAIGGTIQEVPVTGIEINSFIGNEDTTGNANVTLTGISATGSVGDIIPISTYNVTGSSATFAVGQITGVGNAVVTPTGIGLTTATGSPNIIAWAEVNTGTPVTWTEVDLAA
jgi:hypothetical protein